MGWIFFIAGRLVSRKRGGPPILSVLGIAVGVLALTVIISVMNGFQLGFIESILEISSYYVRLEPPPGNGTGPAENGAPPDGGTAGDGGPEGELIRRIQELPGVRAAVPFRELQALLRGEWNEQTAVLQTAPVTQAAVIRALPPNALAEDPGMAEKLVFEEGSFSLAAEDSILLGAELAARLKLGLGDTVELLSINSAVPAITSAAGYGAVSGDGETEPAAESRFVIRGIFRSGFYDYDLNWAFINFDRAGILGGPDWTLGIKLRDRFEDKKIAAEIAGIAAGYSALGAGYRIKTWRDFNRAFFGALRTEKLFMFVLVGLIFIVVGLNIYQAQRRIVLERREEIGLLRAAGAGDRAVRLVFVWDGFIIGLTGAGPGMILGLLLSFNIAAFFSVLEKTVNAVLALAHRGGGFAVFSPAVFYIKELEARVIPREALLIFLFGLCSALLAAWFASGRVSRIRPAEVLRYE